MNISVVIGNLGSDAEVVSSNGARFVTMSVAHTRKFKRQDGTEVNDTQWIDVILSNADSPIIPYLKAGVKICAIGSETLRVYSSKKDRCMKAGKTVHAMTIELCGGSSDDVPRLLIDPATGAIFDVSKHYWCNVDQKDWRNNEKRVFVDNKGNQFEVAFGGWVKPLGIADDSEEKSNADDNNAKQE